MDKIARGVLCTSLFIARCVLQVQSSWAAVCLLHAVCYRYRAPELLFIARCVLQVQSSWAAVCLLHAGCYRYRAPELLFGTKLQTIAIDIWYEQFIQSSHDSLWIQFNGSTFTIIRCCVCWASSWVCASASNNRMPFKHLCYAFTQYCSLVLRCTFPLDLYCCQLII